MNDPLAEAARHIAGVSAHELSAITNRHLSVDKINEEITYVVNAFMRLDLVKAWGDGTSVAAEGTQMDTSIDNLLAESSIRYGGSGGITCALRRAEGRLHHRRAAEERLHVPPLLCRSDTNSGDPGRSQASSNWPRTPSTYHTS
ncbi:Tn3 family transposase [Streptomyces sp. IBSNAI002]|uniref:Tn3 family transposase n=1 Tax=Streptomyces sp. IBSNAI002 TaxID=3457500 RepID=UPI003FCFDCDF